MSTTDADPDDTPDGETPRVVQTDDVLGGRPRLEGRRVGVYTLYSRSADGERTPTELAEAYDISVAEVHTALAYAAANPEQMAGIAERSGAPTDAEERVVPPDE